MWETRSGLIQTSKSMFAPGYPPTVISMHGDYAVQADTTYFAIKFLSKNPFTYLTAQHELTGCQV